MPDQSPANFLKPTSQSKKPIRPPRPNPDFLKELQKLGYQRIVGVDEVGRGALAGPLVVGAVEIYQPIDGITDSKLLSSKQRGLFANQIAQYSMQISFGQASNEEIDQLGLKVALDLAYQRALANLQFDLLLTDHLHPPGGGGRFISAIGGDSLFYPVAAASIMAKVYRDQLMAIYHQFLPDFNWQKNAGYGTKEHNEALNAFGPTVLHRRTFLKKLPL